MSDWIQIIFRVPLPVFGAFLLLLIACLTMAIIAYRRRVIHTREIARQNQDLQARVAECAGQTEQVTQTREAYRHFVYTISHEISNPLQSIQTNLDNMARCAPDETARWRQAQQIIAADLQRLTRLTENLRLLSHLETPDAPLIREPVNLKGLIEDVIMALFETAEEHGVRLCYVGPQRPARVMGDRDGLRQVLLNLVENGIKYTDSAGSEVLISVQEEQDRQVVRVSDEGIGIAAEDLPHLFDTAYRAPQAHSFRRQGSGLGLAIVKRIVEQHGGQVRVQSRVGEGTTVSFDLPLYTPAQQT
ncbi:MAG: HAMP domain-containing sensor histidine kinase [Anaerolineae bacterium]